MTSFRQHLIRIAAACMLAAASASAARADSADDAAIADAARLIRTEAGNHRLILLGEKHGTREIPKLVAALVSAYADKGPVLLALEIHRSESDALHRYLASDGSAAARAALTSGPFWNVRDAHNDGRRSYGVLDMIERVRQLRARGARVDIVPYDNASGDVVDSEHRDKAMAERLRATFAGFARGRMIVVAGNVHAMLARPSYAPPEMQTPMGSYLRDLHPYSVDIDANGGESWACLSACGPIAVTPSKRASGRGGDGVYDFEIVLPKFSVARLMDAPPGP